MVATVFPSFDEIEAAREGYAAGLVIPEPMLTNVRHSTSTASWMELQKRRQRNILYAAHPRIRVKAWTKRIGEANDPR